MSQARIEMNAVILPNGKVLALGGSVNDEDTGSQPECGFLGTDPEQPSKCTFSSAGANAYRAAVPFGGVAAAGRDGLGGGGQSVAGHVCSRWRFISLRTCSTRAGGGHAADDHGAPNSIS